jgi:hypothetical protein
MRKSAAEIQPDHLAPLDHRPFKLRFIDTRFPPARRPSMILTIRVMFVNYQTIRFLSRSSSSLPSRFHICVTMFESSVRQISLLTILLLTLRAWPAGCTPDSAPESPRHEPSTPTHTAAPSIAYRRWPSPTADSYNSPPLNAFNANVLF